MSVRTLLCFLLTVLLLPACKNPDMVQPGTASNIYSQSYQRFYPPGAPVVITVPGTTTQPGSVTVYIPPAAVAEVSSTNEKTMVVQPENPAGKASLSTGHSTKAEVPAAYPPPGPPRPESSSDKALGAMVYLGIAIVVIGGLGFAACFIPYTALIANSILHPAYWGLVSAAGAAVIVFANTLGDLTGMQKVLVFGGAGVAVVIFFFHTQLIKAAKAIKAEMETAPVAAPPA